MARIAMLSLLLLPITLRAEGIEVRVQTTTTTISGKLNAIATNGDLTISGKAIPAVGVVAWAQVDRTIPEPPVEPHLLTSVGDRIPGKIDSIEENGIRMSAQLGRAISFRVPLSVAGVVWLARSDSQIARTAEWQSALTGPRRRDVVLLRNRDVLMGTLIQLNGEQNKCRFDRQSAEARTAQRNDLEVSRLAAIAFNTSLTRTRKPTKPYCVLTLVNGARVQFSTWQSNDETFTGTTLFGADLELNLSDIVECRIMNGQAVYLSDLKANEYTETPYLGAKWNWTADHAWGEPLRLSSTAGPTVRDKGIAMHSASTLTYTLGGRYTRFETLIGLQHGYQGHATVSVRLDGKAVMLEGGEIVAPGNARPLMLDVSGKKELTLVVDFGQRGPVDDRVIWGDARLIRK